MPSKALEESSLQWGALQGPSENSSCSGRPCSRCFTSTEFSPQSHLMRHVLLS